MSAVVSDTSPIHALNHLALLGLIPRIEGRTLVPVAVATELASPQSGLGPIEIGRRAGFEIVAVRDTAAVAGLLEGLDPGESEEIILAREVSAAVLLMDERDGRAEAIKRGLNVVGTLGVLLRARKDGLLPAIAPMIDRLRDDIQFFASDDLRASILRLSGE